MNSAPERTAVLTRAQRKVLADIELFQDDYGNTRLSLSKIAQLNAISKATAFRAVAELNRLGLLRTAQGNAGRATVHRTSEQVLLRSVLVSNKLRGRS